MKAAVIRMAMRFWPALADWLVGDRSYLHDRMLRRYDLLTQLRHEVNKVRNGGYWQDQKQTKPWRARSKRPDTYAGKGCFRWVQR